MSVASLPVVIDAAALAARLGDEHLRVVDLSRREHYLAAHVAGAVHLDYQCLVAAAPPVGGLLPPPEQLSELFASLGIDADTTVVACDDEGGGRAGRLLWTLHALGHRRAAVVDGGMVAWRAAGLPTETAAVEVAPASFAAADGAEVVADAGYILERLGAEDFIPLDTRSAREYSGEDCRAARGGHIPGAAHMDWVEAIDRGRDLRLVASDELRALLAERGVTPEREVVVYCQTHHRSSHTYTVLRALGYPRVRGYPGAWSDWGNRGDTPVESGARRPRRGRK